MSQSVLQYLKRSRIRDLEKKMTREMVHNHVNANLTHSLREYGFYHLAGDDLGEDDRCCIERRTTNGSDVVVKERKQLGNVIENFASNFTKKYIKFKNRNYVELNSSDCH